MEPIIKKIHQLEYENSLLKEEIQKLQEMQFANADSIRAREGVLNATAADQYATALAAKGQPDVRSQLLGATAKQAGMEAHNRAYKLFKWRTSGRGKPTMMGRIRHLMHRVAGIGKTPIEPIEGTTRHADWLRKYGNKG